MTRTKKAGILPVILSCLLMINTIISPIMPSIVVMAATPVNDTVNPPQPTEGKTNITTWNFSSLDEVTAAAPEFAATSGYYKKTLAGTNSTLQLFRNNEKFTTGFGYSTGTISNSGYNGQADKGYWLISTSTKGFKDLVFNFNTRSSGTGPRDFTTEWRTDDMPWTVFGNTNTIKVSETLTIPTTVKIITTSPAEQFGMALPAEAANQDKLYIRIVQKSEISEKGGIVASGGTHGVNNLQLYGTKDPLYTTPTVTAAPAAANPVLDTTPITLSCADSNAQIYYTTDGTVPAAIAGGSTKLYTAPFTALSEGGFAGTNPFVVKAVAKSPGLLPCDTVTLSFNHQTITSNADAKKLADGTYVWVKGIGTYLNGNAALYIQDGMNVGSGLCIYKSGADFSSYVGKEIYVNGKASSYNGLMEIVPDDVTKNVVVRNDSPTIPIPSKIMFDQLADRAYEGMLIAFDTVKLDKVAGTDTAKFFNHKVSQAGISCTLRAKGITSAVGTTGSYVNITKAIANYYFGVQLLSANTTDLEAAAAPTVEFMTINPANGTSVPLNSKVTLATITPGAAITYSLNGGAPVTSTGNSADVTIDAFPGGKATIRATATAADGTYTTAAQTFTYTQSKAADVSANPGSSAVYAGSSITLSSTTTGSTIVYSLYKNSYSSTDGTLVGTADQTYTAPIILDASYFPVRITAKATLANYLDSDVSTFTYTAKKAAGGEKNYYGSIHAHTAENSDGQGTLAEADAYARDQGKFDFFILTDHSNSFDKAPAEDTVASIGNINNYNTANQQWLNGKAAAAAATTPTFLCDYGYEMTWSGGPGHMNTFNTTGFVSRNNTELNNKVGDAGMQSYYQLLKNTPGSITQFNHPGATFGNFSDFAYYDPAIDDKVNLVEVGNGEGAVNSGGYFQSIDQYILALDKGWHLAPTNNGDNHKKGWGTSNTCATVVYTNDFTMSGIYQAMRDRSVWATENRDLDVTYHLNDGTNTYSMGAILDAAPMSANITVTAKNKNPGIDTSDIASIQLISFGGKVVNKQEYAAGTSDVTYTYAMTAPAAGYYFAKITDNQGFVAVTSPIWLGSAIKVGITSVVNSTVMPVTTEALNLTTTFFNNESTAAVLKSISYTVDGDASANKNYDLGTSIPSTGSITHEFSYTPTTAGTKTVNISAVITFNGADYNYTTTSTMKVLDIDKVMYVGLDASHGNEYVSGGKYPNSMGNMMTLALNNNVRVVELKTSQEFINACSNPKYKMMILNAPTRQNYAIWPNATNYTADEIAALKTFSENGNTLVLGIIADYAESTNYDTASPKKHMAELQNDVLSAIGSTLREGDDEVMDEDKNGGDAYRLYPTEFNMANPLMQGVVDGQTYSQYSGSAIYAVDPATGERTSILPKTVSPLVYGFPTTYSAECDNDNFGYGTANDAFPFVSVSITTTKGTSTYKTDKGMSNSQGLYIPKYVNSNSSVAVNPEEKLLAASENVVHPNGKTSLVVVAGGSFMSNFEVQVTMENAATLPYANYNIMDNLYKVVNPLTITSIADAKNLPDGTDVIIEATATSEVNTLSTNSDTNKGFFDCIYAQDSTGGINLFPVASGIKEGQKARFFGKITHYQGEVELTVRKVTILDQAINKLAPAALKTNDSMLHANTGLLVKTQGVVSNVYKDADGTVNQFTINDGTGPAIVFINGYITKGTTLNFIKDGAIASVVGLASIGEVVSDSDMHPRIRVRDRSEIVNIEKALTGIAITQQPAKTQYVVGESLDLTGIVITGTYNDLTTAPLTITSANISGFDSSTTGTKTVTVTVDGKTAAFNVEIKLAVTASEKETLEAYDESKILELIGNDTTKEITVLADSNQVIDKSVFEALKGEDKTLIIKVPTEDKPYISEMEFTFNGLNVKPEDIKSMDLSLKAVSEYKDEILALDKDALILSFNGSGNLPGITNVRIKLSQFSASDKLYIYYFNPETNKAELVEGPLSPDKDGYITVAIKHFSDYFISKKAPVTISNLPKTGSPIDLNLLISLGLMFIAAGTCYIFKKKRAVKKS
ncbi:MAG: bacterial Ig-like domain-containing protein [Bacillota bacterium]|nr:bacterial Ig-like domain-containing protein [Bacillota bacterium]